MKFLFTYLKRSIIYIKQFYNFIFKKVSEWIHFASILLFKILSIAIQNFLLAINDDRASLIKLTSEVHNIPVSKIKPEKLFLVGEVFSTPGM